MEEGFDRLVWIILGCILVSLSWRFDGLSQPYFLGVQVFKHLLRGDVGKTGDSVAKCSEVHCVECHVVGC